MICGRCGRRLKDSASIKIGYGPVCYKKMFRTVPKTKASARGKMEERGDFHDYMIPGQMEMADFLRG